jgi:hypothetical protein
MQNEENPDDIIIGEDVYNILRESLKQKLKKENKYRNSSQLKTALKSILGEFFTCYKIIGYDMDGNVIDITNVSNKMEESAMQNLFMQKFGEFMVGKSIGPDFD